MRPICIWPYLFGGLAAAPLSSFNVSAKTLKTVVTTSTDQSTASLSFNSDGTVTGTESNLGAGTWHSNPAAGLGTSYWVIVTITSGAVTSGTVGSRVQLTGGTSWTATTTGTATRRIKSVVGTFELWDAASGGNMVSSGTLTLDAQVEASETSSTTGGADPATDGLERTRLVK